MLAQNFVSEAQYKVIISDLLIDIIEFIFGHPNEHLIFMYTCIMDGCDTKHVGAVTDCFFLETSEDRSLQSFLLLIACSAL